MIDEPLSPEGMQRRDAILRMAKATARRRRGVRLMSRTLAAAVVVGIGVFVVSRLPVTRPVETKTVARQSVPAPSAPPTVAIEYVQTDPTITDRLTLPASPPRWASIGDDELLSDLAAAGQPAGIVSMNGKSILLPRAQMR